MADAKKDIPGRIEALKKQKNAVILSHNYQLPEIQDMADYVGDSLELSRQAAQTDAKIIVFCGVDFMAETAKILSPGKIVLLPDKDAACPLSAMITAEELRAMKAKHKGAVVVSYVNTSAAVKAESDYCCTSANAVKVVNAIDAGEIIFTPDKYLADYVSRKTGKKLIAWHGYCPTHARILPEHIMSQKRLHPEAKVIVHPECRREVIDLADEVASTSGMCRYAKSSPAKEFIIGTERELIYRLSKENPGRKFYHATELAVCPNMKRITLHKVLESLEEMKHEVVLPEEIIRRARMAVDRMLEIA